MEAQPAALVMLLISLVTRSQLPVQLVNAGGIVLLALGLLWWAMLVESLLRRTQRARLGGWLYVMGWLAAFAALGWPYVPHLLTGVSIGALFLDALLVTWFWRRGMRRAQVGFRYGEFITSFKIGFGVLLGILLLVIVLPQESGLRDALAAATPVYFLSGLIAISLSRLGGIRRESPADDAQADPTRPWLFALAAFGLALLLLTVLIELIFPFHAFESVLTILTPVWNAIGTGLSWLLYGVVFLLWPIYLLISFLVGLFRGKGNQQQPPPIGNLHRPPVKGPQGPPAIPPELYTIGRGVLIALAVLVVVLVIRSFLKRRLVRGRDEEVEEVREGLDARSLLSQRWREWWNRRRRKSDAAPGLELLDPDSARARYREVLLAAAEVGEGLPRRPPETPTEYQARLLASLEQAPPDQHPATLEPVHADAAVLEELTGAYNGERYGGRRTDERKRARLRAGVPYLLGRLKGRAARAPARGRERS
jgi:ABC-type xylose transport system permease subunit